MDNMKDLFLFITQSGPGGINRVMADSWIEHLKQTFDDGVEFVLVNADEVTNDQIKDACKIVMIVPEWNGSFPFMFKKMVDDSGYPSVFDGCDVAVVGTSNSPFGNIMGSEHLGYVLRWVGANVYPRKMLVPNFNNITSTPDLYTRILDELAQFLSWN